MPNTKQDDKTPSDDQNPDVPDLGDTWELLASSDNWVFVNQLSRQVFKTAKSGKEHRVLNGFQAAKDLDGVDVVLAPENEMQTISGMRGSMWPLVTDPRPATSAETLRLCEELASTGRHFGSFTFDPITKVGDRMADMTADAVAMFRPYYLRLETLLSDVADDQIHQHGDAKPSNVVGGQLIDFDSAGLYPRGWDRACIFYRQLLLEGATMADISPDDPARTLVAIKFSFHLSWCLLAGFTPDSWDDRDQIYPL